MRTLVLNCLRLEITESPTVNWNVLLELCWPCVSASSTTSLTFLHPLSRGSFPTSQISRTSSASLRNYNVSKQKPIFCILSFPTKIRMIMGKLEFTATVRKIVMITCTLRYRDIKNHCWFVKTLSLLLQEVTYGPFHDINDHFLKNAITGECSTGTCPVSNSKINKEFRELKLTYNENCAKSWDFIAFFQLYH